MHSGYASHTDLVFGEAKGKPLTLDLFLPKNPIRSVPLIMYIHGGGWRGLSKSWCPYPMRFLALEYAVASINYRLVPEATFPAQLHDCKAAVRWLRAHAQEYGLLGDRIGVWGDSAGGHLAAMLGVTGDRPELEGDGGTPGVSSKVQAVCDWFGPTELVSIAGATADDPESFVAQFIGGAVTENMELARAASPVTYVSGDAAPMLIMHGDVDRQVPLSQSVALYEALWRAGAEVRLHIVHGGAHLSYTRRPTDIPWHAPEVQQLVDAFFWRHLMCDPTP